MKKNRSALLIVDVQNDFIPGGALAVNEGDKIVPLINQLLHKNFRCKVASKDWHPTNHGSFAATHKKKTGEKIHLDGLEQILWPVHCVQNSSGADFPTELEAHLIEKIIHKGTENNIDSYSAFFDNGKRKATELHEYLQKKGIDELYVVGLATDYCVKHSVLDALALGYKTHVIIDACRGVNLKPMDTTNAINDMRIAGAHMLHFSDLSILS